MIIKRWDGAVTSPRSANTTSGSNAVSIATSGLTVGSGISGPGIPAGTTIASIPSVNNITMSANATATATGVVLTVTGLFLEQYPKTVAQKLFNNAANIAIFDSNDKIKPQYLPDSVFDSLYFFGAVSSGFANGHNANLSRLAFDAIVDASDVNLGNNDTGRNFLGYYWVNSSSTNTYNGNTTSDIYPTIAQVTTAETNNRLFSSWFQFGTQAPRYVSGDPNGVITGTNNSGVQSTNGIFYTNTGGGTVWSAGQTGLTMPAAFSSGISNTGNYYDTRTRTLYTYGGTNNTFGQFTAVTVTGTYIQTNFQGNEENSTSTTTTSLEVGDWFVISKVTGLGTLASPYIITFGIVNNTYALMTGANGTVAGAPGLVPTPQATDNEKFLRGDGTWVVPTDNNTTAITSTAGTSITGTDKISFLTSESTAITDAKFTTIVAGTNVELNVGTAGQVTISSSFTDTNTTAITSTAGTSTTGDGKIQFLTSESTDITAAKFTKLVAGTNVSLDIGTGGQVTISSTDTNTVYTHPNHTGDVTSVGDGATTIVAKAVTFAKFQDSVAAGLSVIGRSAASAGSFAEVAAGTDHHVLRRSGSTLGFGTIATAGIADDAVTFAKIQNSAAAGLSVIGRSANSAGAFAEVVAGTDGHVLRRSGTTLAFGTIATAGIADDAVTYAKLQNITATNRILGRIATGAGIAEELTATNVRSIIELGAPIYIQTATPAATVTNALWYDIN
jgi:hypothetical protein